MQQSAQQLRALEKEDIERILELSKAGKSDGEIASELCVPHWAVMLIKSLYG